MFAYLTAAFFSVLSNCICVYFVNNGLIVLKQGQMIMDIFLINNIINMILFIILFNIQKIRRRINFKVIDNFRNKKEIIQFLLFIFPVIAAFFKTYMLDFVPVTTITISSLIVPFIVWILATFLLRERFKSEYLKYSIIAVIGFILVNIQKLSDGSFSFGFMHFLLIYILLESIGQITLRYYCRKRDYGMQAILAEIVIFFVYGSIFLIVRETFSIELFLNPYVWLISCCCFLRHILLINGVRKASSIVALEFCAFAKPIFASIIMFILIGEIPTLKKIIGFVIIAFSIVRFHSLERKYKQEKKAIGLKLFDKENIDTIKTINQD